MSFDVVPGVLPGGAAFATQSAGKLSVVPSDQVPIDLIVQV